MTGGTALGDGANGGVPGATPVGPGEGGGRRTPRGAVWVDGAPMAWYESER
jgi:hypothetical protein